MQPLVFALWVSAVFVKQPGAVLRSGGCDRDAPEVVKLAEGQAVEVRSSIAGAGGACYRVAMRAPDGSTIVGNLPGDALGGLEEFEETRRAAAGSGDAVEMTVAKQVDALRKAIDPKRGSGAFQDAYALIEVNQPLRALEALAQLLPSTNPDVMVLAGIAAWKSDQVKLAIGYWKSAQALRADPVVGQMIARVEKELAFDKSGERVTGVRVALRYESQSLPYTTAKSLADALDSEVSRISGILGCAPQEKLIAILQSPDAYRQGSSAAEWSGGQFDGRIRVPVPASNGLDPRLRQVLAHEVTHACLASMGRWPSWLHEGLAQKLSGERMPEGMRDAIKELAAAKELPRLQDFRQDWSRMSARHARIAYATALAAADELVEGPGASIGLRAILTNPALLDQVTNTINKRLGITQ